MAAEQLLQTATQEQAADSDAHTNVPLTSWACSSVAPRCMLCGPSQLGFPNVSVPERKAAHVPDSEASPAANANPRDAGSVARRPILDPTVWAERIFDGEWVPARGGSIDVIEPAAERR